MKINRITARDSQIAPNPSPESFGAAEGRALQSLGGSLQQAGNVGLQIVDGYYEQLAISRGMDAEDQIRRVADEQLLNTDFEGREGAFTQRADAIRLELGEGLTPSRRADFDRIVKQARNRHGLTLRSATQRDELESATLMANETARKAAMRVATSSDPLDAIEARIEGESAYRKLAQRFGIPEAKLDESIRGFHRMITDGVFVERLRSNPAAAFALLETPERGLAIGLTEVERQQRISRAVGEIERQILREDTSLQAVHAKEERERKRAAFDAGVAIVQAGRTESGASLDMVYEFSDVLGEEKTRQLAQWVANTGGRVQLKQNNVTIFDDLMKRAKAGDFIGDDVLQEELGGNIDTAARNALLRESEDIRFGPADEYLDGLISPMGGNPAQRERQGMARMHFSIWKSEHQDATMEEAFDAARDMADRARIFDTSEVRIAQFPPRLGVFEADGRTMSLQQTQNMYAKALEDGSMTPEEFDREMDLVDRYMRAQEAEQARTAARESAQGGGR